MKCVCVNVYSIDCYQLKHSIAQYSIITYGGEGGGRGETSVLTLYFYLPLVVPGFLVSASIAINRNIISFWSTQVREDIMWR